MKTLVTGASGFTGEHVVRKLLQGSDEVVAFVRSSSQVDWLRELGVAICFGDLGDQASLLDAFQGVEVLINVASLGSGHVANVIAAAEAERVRRAVFVSTSAVETTMRVSSKSVRLKSERLIKASKLRYTIVRPTMIYGTPRDRNIWRLINYLRRWPIAPVVGTGLSLQQPVYVEDVAQAIVQARIIDQAVGLTYNLAGASPLSFVDMIDTVCGQLGRRVMRLHIPLSPALYVSRILHPFGWPVSSEQLHRLNEDKVFDISPARADLCYTPLSFSEGLTRELTYL